MSPVSEPFAYIFENLTRRRVIAKHILSAATSSQRRRGLLHATELGSDDGLWINPCEAVHTFGMKIPLDALFLDAALRVRKITANLRPNRIAFCLAATSVLELSAGSLGSSGTECGDQLGFHRTFAPTGEVNVGR